MADFDFQQRPERMKSRSAAGAVAAMSCVAAAAAWAADPAPAWQSLTEIVSASPASDWRMPDPANTLYLELPTGRVVIELAPAFAPLHIANIKTLVAEKYFDGLTVIRSQDNYVAQWGDREEKRSLGSAKKTVPSEVERPLGSDLPFTLLADRDVYAPIVGFSAGFPVARDAQKIWLAHCYGMVGIGRGNDAESANGTQLYVVNGHSPRHLDRNVPLVGRVLAGMELLSVQPRGKGALGFYEHPEEGMTIRSVRLASDVPLAERSKLEAMRTDSVSFAKVVESRRNCHSEWCKYAAGAIELCNVQLPVRLHKD
jgi:cyclophilin family peptidyl-prolyl cis-trans isomerase